jgi:hypothetical protein
MNDVAVVFGIWHTFEGIQIVLIVHVLIHM